MAKQYDADAAWAALREKAMFGPTIQIDPLFPYYTDRSPESVAEEVELAGYRAVHYFVVNENKVNRALIDAFHKRGMAVWALVIGNGTFSTEHLPEGWKDWQMELLKPVKDGFWRFSPFSRPYREWKKEALAKLVLKYPFDGIEIAEPYFPEWGGIERGVYGDVGPLAGKAFRESYGREMPEFRDAKSERYYKKDRAAYDLWIRFRVETVNGFLSEMINGQGGVREARPDILVATWSLALDAGPDSVMLLREYQGLDASSMIANVRPDIHFLQTHWPDWGKGDLPADYVKSYRRFAEPIRRDHPDAALGVQADIGSARHMVKGGAWLKRFAHTVEGLGYDTWTAYEYHLGGYMYDSAPVPVSTGRTESGDVRISFNKRIDPASATEPASFIPSGRGTMKPVEPSAVTVDGNRIILRGDAVPRGPFRLEIRNIRDLPSRWLFNDRSPNRVPERTVVWCPQFRPTSN